VLVAVCIKIGSKGSLFYKQIRVGKGGVEFTLLKFRTMKIGSDKDGLLTVGMDDPRITRTGKLLRKFKIDELPQLINVIRGEMSLVGPRPEVKKYVDLYTDEQRKVLKIKPGITDYASIEFANENEFLALSSNFEKTYIEEIVPLKIKMNMKYINKPSLYQYFKIIFMTIIRIFSIYKN
jgi:lipopolysaccharide/colanic/teichoic acid biosynthesis glycosyltransferase